MTARRLVILGATGDLTGRYLLVALAELAAAGFLPDDLAVVGVAREPWDGHVPSTCSGAARPTRRSAPRCRA